MVAYVPGFAHIGGLIYEQVRYRGMPDKNQKRSTLMPDRQVRVTFQPSGRSVFVLPETTILEAAACAGLTIDTPCGGMGTCGKCRVQVINGACEPTEADRQVLGEAELREGWRLGCQTAVCGEAIVHVPDRSLFASQHQILRAANTEATKEIHPAVRKVYVELSAPTLADNVADLRRLEQQVGAFKTDLTLLRQLPGILRKHDFKGTAVLSDHRLIDFEPGDTTSQCCGAAFDLGTTTIVGSLLSLHSGEELAIVSQMNPQVKFGDDVLSRIKYADSCPDCLNDLHRAVVAEIVKMIDCLCAEAKVCREHIYTIAFAGNTTMEHLLCGCARLIASRPGTGNSHQPPGDGLCISSHRRLCRGRYRRRNARHTSGLSVRADVDGGYRH